MASEYITDIAPPAELTGYVRELVDGDLPFAALFPPRTVEDIEYELTNGDLRAAGEVARYRSWDTPAEIGRRPAIATIRGEIPPLAWGYRLNEKEYLQLERVRAGVGDRTDARIVDTIFNDAERAAHAVQNRITLAHGELLQTGVVSLTELGDPVAGNELLAQFAVPANQLGQTPAGADWTDHANSVPVTDLKGWETIHRANNGGQNPAAWGVSSEVMADLALNAQIRTLAGGTSGVTPGIIGDEQVRQVLRAAGVNAPIVVMFDVERPTMSSGTPARVVNARAVIGMSPGMGATPYGTPPASLTLARMGELRMTETPGIVAYATFGIDPAHAKTTAEGLALPILTDPNKLFVAEV